MRAVLFLVLISFMAAPAADAVDKKAWPHAMGLDAERRYKEQQEKKKEAMPDDGLGGGPMLPDGKKRQHAFDPLDTMIADLIDWLDRCRKGTADGQRIYDKRYRALKERLQIERNRLKNEKAQMPFSDKAKKEQADRIEQIQINIKRLEALFKDLPDPKECKKVEKR